MIIQVAGRGEFGGIDISVGVHTDSVCGVEGVVSPGLQHLAVLIELDDGMRTSVEHPDIVMPVYRDAGGFTEVPALGKLRPILDYFVGQRRARFELDRSRRKCRYHRK